MRRNNVYPCYSSQASELISSQYNGEEEPKIGDINGDAWLIADLSAQSRRSDLQSIAEVLANINV